MSDYGIVTESGAVRFERLLPAPPERVWDYLTDGELRGKWFAEGSWELRPGGRIALVFHNSRLAAEGESLPDKFACYEGLETHGRILELDPPRLLVHSWEEEDGSETHVRWELDPEGDQTRLTLTHSRLPSITMTLDVSGGWHLHLDALEDMLAERPRRPFWARQEGLEAEYRRRIEG